MLDSFISLQPQRPRLRSSDGKWRSKKAMSLAHLVEQNPVDEIQGRAGAVASRVDYYEPSFFNGSIFSCVFQQTGFSQPNFNQTAPGPKSGHC